MVGDKGTKISSGLVRLALYRLIGFQLLQHIDLIVYTITLLMNRSIDVELYFGVIIMNLFL